jgi:predicted nucleic acid-binding protein
MSLICLDTHILIWGIKGESNPEQTQMVRSAKKFLYDLQQQKEVQVMIPAVVVGELLMPIPIEQHAHFIKLLGKSFQIPPFDVAAARIFAEIWQSKKSIRQELNGEMGREHMKVDCQIVAIAKVNKAECIYSYDHGLTKFSDGYVPIKQLPTEQGQLDFQFE